MTDAKTCPTCGAPLPADATGGACPKCLLQAGFATGGSAPADRAPTPEELAPKFPGLVISSVLGRGGMGVVYKARHRALDRDVALKVLPASLAGDAAFADRFQREARALAKLQHPNIVAVHDFGTTDGLFWLVMEYVDGANIRQAMKAGTIGPKEALAIVPQICDALQYAHEHGVVHRDIKPENVLLDKTGRVKVADFGLAKLMEHGESDRTLTGAGQVMGTPHYMAPEQWEKPKDVDHRADIYSLGVVFYEMLTGELPVGRFAAPSKKSDVDARIDEIVLRTLEREREARYQNVSQVKTDVGALSVPAVAACDAPLTAEDTAHRKRMQRVIVAASLVCAALVLTVTSHSVPPGIRNVAGWMSIPAGITLIWAAWSQRRGRRAARPPMPGWAIALIVAACLFCGGPLVFFAFFALSNVGSTSVKDLEAANRQKQKDQVAMIRAKEAARDRVNSGRRPTPVGGSWESEMTIRCPVGVDGNGLDLWTHNDFEDLCVAHPLRTTSDALRFYRPEDAARIEAMGEDELFRGRSERTIGLPLAELWGEPLLRFTVKLIEVQASGTEAVATAEIRGAQKIRFPLVREGGRWYCAIGPVEKL